MFYLPIYPIRPCILGNSHGLKVIIYSLNSQRTLNTQEECS